MKKNLIINIPEPCSKKFDQFEPTPLGGFCPSCQKEVIDFTAMTDLEILEYFRGSPKNICGRLSKFQLKTYQEHRPTSKKSNFYWTGLHLLGLSILPFLGIQNAQAQQAEKKTNLQIHQKKGINNINENDTIQKPSIKGVVIDENAEPIPGISVVLEGTNIGTATDVNGQFEFPIALEEGEVLLFSGVGLQTQKIKIDANTPTEIMLSPAFNSSEIGTIIVLGEVSTSEVYTSKRSFWQKLKNMFR